MNATSTPSYRQICELLADVEHPNIIRSESGLRHRGGFMAALADAEKAEAELEAALKNLPAPVAPKALPGPTVPPSCSGAGSKTSARGESGPSSFQPPAPAVRATPRVEPPLFGLKRTEAAFKAETDRKTHPRK